MTKEPIDRARVEAATKSLIAKGLVTLDRHGNPVLTKLGEEVVDSSFFTGLARKADGKYEATADAKKFVGVKE